MPTTTWLNRLIDESNSWFLAVKSEDSSRFIDAVIYYLKDATECARKQLQLQAALSCASAASCLEKSGDPVRAARLYREASLIYENNSRKPGKTTQECTWSLERAYYFSLMSRDVTRANELHNHLLAVQLGDSTAPKEPVEQNIYESAKSNGSELNSQSNDVMKAINEFLAIQNNSLERREQMAVGKQITK